MAMGTARLRYDEEGDRFYLEILDKETGTWGLDVACECVYRNGDDEDEPMYVHYSILLELARCAELGFTIYNC